MFSKVTALIAFNWIYTGFWMGRFSTAGRLLGSVCPRRNARNVRNEFAHFITFNFTEMMIISRPGAHLTTTRQTLDQMSYVMASFWFQYHHHLRVVLFHRSAGHFQTRRRIASTGQENERHIPSEQRRSRGSFSRNQGRQSGHYQHLSLDLCVDSVCCRLNGRHLARPFVRHSIDL